MRPAIDNRPSTSPCPSRSGTRKSVHLRERPAGQKRVSHARYTGIPALGSLRTLTRAVSTPPTTTTGVTGHPWLPPHGYGPTRKATAAIMGLPAQTDRSALRLYTYFSVNV